MRLNLVIITARTSFMLFVGKNKSNRKTSTHLFMCFTAVKPKPRCSEVPGYDVYYLAISAGSMYARK